MRLFEYQAKSFFARHGIPAPQGVCVGAVDELRAAIERVGVPCVLKAQLLQGGRGKLGLVKIADTEDDALQEAATLFASEYGVAQLLVEERVDILHEYYASITIDAVRAEAVILLCLDGGVDIEDVAKSSPASIKRIYVDMAQGLDGAAAWALVQETGLSGITATKLCRLIMNLYDCFVQTDAELAEINPIFITRDGEIVAGDGKLIIDDNSVFRQKGIEKQRAFYNSDMEYEAALQGIPYIQFEGDISLMCAGAGLTNTVYDLVNDEGGSIANYIEFGGPNYTKSEAAMSICLKNASNVILIVTFGTIARADVIAQGVVDACAKLKPDRPLVTCIRGTNEEVANQVLAEAGLECYSDTEEAVKRAIKLAEQVKVQ